MRSDPERLELALLQHAQQLRLQRGDHGADLVEEDRAAVGQRELALLVGDRAGERAPHVAEQLGLEQRLGDRRAVHLDQRPRPLRAPIVDRPRHQLLAGPGLPGHQHRAPGLGDQLRRLDDLLHDPAATHDAVVVELLVALAEEVPVVGLQPLGLRARAARRPGVRRSRTASAGSRARPSFIASTALSTLACAVISTICGRSVSVVDAASSRISSSPVVSGMRLSTRSRSNVRASSSRRASRGPGASTTSWPSSRSTRPSVFRIFSSSSTSRIEPCLVIEVPSPPRGVPRHGAASPRCDCTVAPAARSGSPCPTPGWLAIAIRPPMPSTMFREMASPSPVPPALRREVRLEHALLVVGSDSHAAIAHRDRDPARPRSRWWPTPRPTRPRRNGAASVPPAPSRRGRRLRRACVDGLERVDEQVDEHRAEALRVGHDRRQRRVEHRGARARPGGPPSPRPPSPRTPGSRRSARARSGSAARSRARR